MIRVQVLRPRPRSFALAFALVLPLSAACQKPPADLREWKPSDHTNTTNEATQARQSDGKASSAPPGLDEVTLATWSSKCVVCHGRIGKGDGPQGAMFRPRDLSDPTWQASRTDAQIAEVIQKGLNKMPGFALPEPTLGNMVRLVRLLNAAPAGQPAGSVASQSASPSGATPSARPASPAAASPHQVNSATPASPGPTR